MFLRKLLVMVLPLAMVALLLLLLPLLGNLGFFSAVLQGALIGTLLSLVLPLSGATRRREPFAGLLFVPFAVLVAVIVYQFALSCGMAMPAFPLIFTIDSRAVLAESAFAAFLLVTNLRTVG